MKHRIILVLSAVFTAILLSSCGGNDTTENDLPPPIQTEQETDIDVLTVLAPRIYAAVLNRAATEMRLAWSRGERERDFELDITTYTTTPIGSHTTEERDNQLMRLQLMLMAGESYDLFFLDDQPLLPLVRSGFLMEFYELIEQDATVNLDDFYTNVLQALELDGGLYAFPLGFAFEYIGINSLLPESLVDRFMAKSSITNHEILEIYNDLKQTYAGEFGHLSLGNYLSLSSPAGTILPTMSSFIDFDNRISDLNDPHFISFLEEAQHTFAGVELHFYRGGWGFPISGWYVERNRSQNSVFMVKATMLHPITVLIPVIDTEKYFLNFIPVVDKYGRFRIRENPYYGSWGVICASVSSDSDLVWEFVRRLISAMPRDERLYPGSVFGINSVATPIKREYFEENLISSIEWSAIFGDGPTLTGMGAEREQTIENAIARMAYFNEYPVVFVHKLPSGIYEDPLQALLMGTRTAGEIAQELHNRMTLWFMEIE